MSHFGIEIIVPTATRPSAYSHGAAYTITGTGFGSRSSLYFDQFDDCSSASLGPNYDNEENFAYLTPAEANNQALPHSNIDHYAAAHQLTSFNGSSFVGKDANITTLPTKLFMMYYYRVDDNWTFGSTCNDGAGTDNNFKFMNVSSGGSWFAANYWYHDCTGQKCSLTASWGNKFYSSGSLGSLNDGVGGQGGSGNQADDPFYSWVKFEYRIGIGSSGQELKYLSNNVSRANLTGKNTYDGSGSTFWAGPGCYSRQTTSGNWVYLADIAMVCGDHAYARVMLTDNATYSSSTVVEYQPLVSWSDTAISITLNKGALPAGDAHIHVFDNTDTSQYIGTITLG